MMTMLPTEVASSTPLLHKGSARENVKSAIDLEVELHTPVKVAPERIPFPNVKTAEASGELGLPKAQVFADGFDKVKQIFFPFRVLYLQVLGWDEPSWVSLKPHPFRAYMLNA
jgi:hypothetical protein